VISIGKRSVVPKEGLEPSRPGGRRILNPSSGAVSASRAGESVSSSTNATESRSVLRQAITPGGSLGALNTEIGRVEGDCSTSAAARRPRPSPAQIETLVAIHAGTRALGHPPALVDLAAAFGVSRNAIFEQLRACIRKRLVACPDRKAHAYALTPYGVAEVKAFLTWLRDEDARSSTQLFGAVLALTMSGKRFDLVWMRGAA